MATMTSSDVSIGKLLALLAETTEHERLDYKGEFHPDEAKAWVELAKDVGAMQVDGGYLVFGADNNGVPTGAITPEQAKRLDEAAVRGKLHKWLDEPFEIRTGEHLIYGKLMVLMRIEPNQDGFCVFKENGAYGSNTGKEEHAFRKGEVFARHGSASERWQQPDIARIKRNLKRRGDEAERAHVMTAILPLCRILVEEPQLMLHVAGVDGEKPLTLTRVKEIVGRMVPSKPPPQIANATNYANWWGFLRYWYLRSSKTLDSAMRLSSFLDPELATVLHKIQQNAYFQQFDDLFHPPELRDLQWLVEPMWLYLQLTGELAAYLARTGPDAR